MENCNCRKVCRNRLYKNAFISIARIYILMHKLLNPNLSELLMLQSKFLKVRFIIFVFISRMHILV